MEYWKHPLFQHSKIPRPNARLNERIHSFGQVPFGTGGHYSPVEIAPTSHFTGQALFPCRNSSYVAFHRAGIIPL